MGHKCHELKQEVYPKGIRCQIGHQSPYSSGTYLWLTRKRITFLVTGRPSFLMRRLQFLL